MDFTLPAASSIPIFRAAFVIAPDNAWMVIFAFSSAAA
jgi:hypothetical protein